MVAKRDGGLDSRSQAHQQSALQASVQNDIAGTDPGANSPRGLVASVDLKDAFFHIQIAPRTFSKCMDAAPPIPSERAECAFSII